ncbi:MAG: ABC transporter substrate-binding protein [Clostridia bacterium]|nr:ABC transporter substrate-binding protein [Clostridia bacterium]
MKKITIFCCSLVLSLAFVLVGCTDTNDNKIRLNEVTHSIFYAPLYVAINNGYFEDEGLEIELTNGGGADKVMTALVSGEADIGLMGPEASIYVVQEGAKDKPVVFGQLTKRDGSFLMSHTAEPDFEWTDLKGKEIIGGRRGGVPAMVLEYVLKQNGLKPGDALSDTVDTILNLDVQFNLVAAAFEGKPNSYCTMFEPTASDYEVNSKGYIVASVGQASGEIPYTAFTAKSSYLKNNAKNCEKFLTAVMKGYYFIMNSSLDAVAASLKPSFSDTSLESIKTAVEQYKLIDAWNNTPVMQADAFDRLQTIMMSAGELDEKVSFSSVVNNDIAFKVMQSFN